MQKLKKGQIGEKILSCFAHSTCDVGAAQAIERPVYRWRTCIDSSLTSWQSTPPGELSLLLFTYFCTYVFKDSSLFPTEIKQRFFHNYTWFGFVKIMHFTKVYILGRSTICKSDVVLNLKREWLKWVNFCKFCNSFWHNVKMLSST